MSWLKILWAKIVLEWGWRKIDRAERLEEREMKEWLSDQPDEGQK